MPGADVTLGGFHFEFFEVTRQTREGPMCPGDGPPLGTQRWSLPAGLARHASGMAGGFFASVALATRSP